MQNKKLKRSFIAVYVLSMPLFGYAHAGDGSISFSLMPQQYSAYVEVQLNNTSSYDFQLTFILKNNDQAVGMTASSDPIFPTTCGMDLPANTTCNIWLHSTNNKQIGSVNEGQLDVQATYQGVIINSQSFNLNNETDLYAGGYFSQITYPNGSTINVNYIAKWDGTKWSALRDNLSGPYPYVNALTVATDGSIYAGGSFTQAGGISTNAIASWNPVTQQWSALGSGLNSNASVDTLTLGSDGALYAAGYFTQAGSISANSIAKWDPRLQQWSALGSGLDSYAKALTTSADGSIYVVGNFTHAGGQSTNYIAKWDPSLQQWSALGSGLAAPSFIEVDALATGTDGLIYAGGSFTQAGSVSANAIASWNPVTQQWSALGNGLLSGGASAACSTLAITPTGLINVGGNFTQAGGVSANAIASWNPVTQQWSALGSDLIDGVYLYVSALTTGADDTTYMGIENVSTNSNITNSIQIRDPVTQQWSTLSTLNNGVYALVIAPKLFATSAP